MSPWELSFVCLDNFAHSLTSSVCKHLFLDNSAPCPLREHPTSVHLPEAAHKW